MVTMTTGKGQRHDSPDGNSSSSGQKASPVLPRSSSSSTAPTSTSTNRSTSSTSSSSSSDENNDNSKVNDVHNNRNIGRNTSYRPIPILSEIIYFPVILWSACLHYALRSLPPRVEATVAMTVMGGLFGFLLIPLAFFVLLAVAVEVLSEGQIPTTMTLYYVVIPFFAVYVVQILIFDKTHLKVENAGPPRPRYFLEDAAWKFADSVWKYYPTVECIPCRYSNEYHKKNSSNSINKTGDESSKDDDGVFLPPGQQYIFGVHPHGIHCLPLGLFGTQNGAFDSTFPGLYGPKLIGICATVIFKIPVVRELFFHMGYIDASRSVCDRALRVPNQSLFICIGGEEESMLSTKGKDEVVLLKRKGFVRLALAHGCALVPCFGVNNTDTSPPPTKKEEHVVEVIHETIVLLLIWFGV